MPGPPFLVVARLSGIGASKAESAVAERFDSWGVAFRDPVPPIPLRV